MKTIFEKWKRKLAAILAAVLLLFLSYAMFVTYSAYTQMVVEQQQQHLLLISRAVAQNLQLYISEQLRTVSTLTQTPGFIDGMEEYYAAGKNEKIKEYVFSYMLSHQQGLSRIYLLNKEGEKIFHYNQYPFLEDFDEQVLNLKTYGEAGKSGIGDVFPISDKHYGLTLVNSVYGGSGYLGSIVCVVDMEALYKQFVAPLNVDKLGYITVKNEQQTVIMHPDSRMLSFNYQTDIKDLDVLPQYESLYQMLENQYSKEEGTAIYESFSNGILPPEREISAFSRMNLDGTSWYVSTVMPYSEAVEIENDNLRRFGLLGGAVLALVIAAVTVIYILQRNRQKLQIETRYLREINSTMEELNQSREQVRHYQKLMTIGALAGGIAHEFNNLLTPIMGYSEFLMEQMGNDSEYYEDIKEIFTAGTKAKEIIEQILPFSRKETDSTEFRSVSIDVIVHDALKMIKLLIPANIVLKEELGAAGVSVYGNATQLHQILLNLYSNAYQSMDENGGVLRVSSRKVLRGEMPETYRDAVDSDFVEVVVEDTGCGMSEEVLHQIFNPFFSTKEAGEGTGLGLSLVKNILISHGGFIIAKSEAGKGSRFFVYLPVTDIPETEPEYVETAEEDVKNSTILLVDDDSYVLKYLKKRLEKKGYQVDAFTDAKEAINAMDKQPNRWKAAVLDYMMPQMKGTTLAKRMKKLRPSMGIIIITGLVEREVLQMKQDGIIDSVLIKPVKFEELLTAIDWISTQKDERMVEKL